MSDSESDNNEIRLAKCNINLNGSRYIFDCKNKPCLNSEFCKSHKCIKKNCCNIRRYYSKTRTFSRYCKDHEDLTNICAANGFCECQNECHDGSPYCAEHKCEQEKCIAMKQYYSGSDRFALLCDSHNKVCSAQNLNCENTPSEGSVFCMVHKCKQNGCMAGVLFKPFNNNKLLKYCHVHEKWWNRLFN